MPIYCFFCDNCKEGFDKMMKMSESDKIPECPICKDKGKVKKKMTSSNVHYKGSGFYTTDYTDKLK